MTEEFREALLERAMRVCNLYKLAPLVGGLFVIVTFAGCWKKSGEAIVLEKEHIDAAEPRPTPPAEPSATPQESPASVECVERELAPDEIEVGSHVMKKDLRGTSKDPRAMRDEQWLVKVQMVADLRRITVHTDRVHFEKAKVGNRLKVSYSQGKYTGSIWCAEIND